MSASVIAEVVFFNPEGEERREYGLGNVAVEATLVDGSVVQLLAYYSDELTFVHSDFLGLTVQEARDLKTKRDIEYLRS